MSFRGRSSFPCGDAISLFRTAPVPVILRAVPPPEGSCFGIRTSPKARFFPSGDAPRSRSLGMTALPHSEARFAFFVILTECFSPDRVPEGGGSRGRFWISSEARSFAFAQDDKLHPVVPSKRNDRGRETSRAKRREYPRRGRNLIFDSEKTSGREGIGTLSIWMIPLNWKMKTRN